MPQVDLSQITRPVLLRFMHKALSEIEPVQGRGEAGWFRISDLFNRTLTRVAQGGFIPDPMSWFLNNPTTQNLDHRHPLLTKLADSYQQLLTLGYVVPLVENYTTLSNSAFQITETGSAWIAADTTLIPEAPDEYLAALRKLVPEVDQVVFEYVREALAGYNHRAFFAAAVMIGAAGEKLLYLMVEAMKNSATDPSLKQQAENSYTGRSIMALFRTLNQSLAVAKQRRLIDSDMWDNVDVHLLALEDGIRQQRNDAVHPQTANVSQEKIFMTLYAFPTTCRKAYDLIGWFSSHPL